MATYNGNVVGGSLALRSSTNSGSRLATIPNGTALIVSTISGNAEWFSTSYSGYNGYVMAEFVGITTGGGSCEVSTTSDSLNVRKSPSGSVIFTAAKGSILRLIDYTSTSGWYRVSNSEGTGWASSDYLTILTYPSGSGSSDGSTYPYSATVETSKHGDGGYLNLRETASTNADAVAEIPNGSTIYVQSLTGEWLAAKYNNYTGYVMAKFVVGTDAYNGTTDSESSGSTLQKGSTGSEVVTLQNRLTALRYYCGAADGTFGQKTYLAVKYFQERNALSVDGVVGTNTWNKLNASNAVQGVDSSIINWTATERPVAYYQNSSFWSNYPYDANQTSTVETVGNAACGPTSMAMVVSTLLKKAVIPPILSDWALENNYRDHAGDNGTSFSFFRACAQAFGLTYGGTLTAKTTATFNTIADWCNSGGLAVINAYSASPYTTQGHYLVCYKVENNVVYIQESNYNHRNYANHTVSEWINTSNGNWFGSIALIK